MMMLNTYVLQYRKILLFMYVKIRRENYDKEQSICKNWVLKIDAERTKKYNDSIAVEEGCLCIYCKHIKTVKLFKRSVGLYTMLGIDPKEGGMEFPADTDKHLYMGFYHLVGK